jgi:hypothetical protein
MSEMPKAGEAWRHYKLELYEIVGTGHDAETGQATVTYKRYNGRLDDLWTHKLSDFLALTADHKQRFTRSPNHDREKEYPARDARRPSTNGAGLHFPPLTEDQLVWLASLPTRSFPSGDEVVGAGGAGRPGDPYADGNNGDGTSS